MSGQPGDPLGAEEFARLMSPFEPFERHPSVAVAVSGGRDSLALAVLLKDWIGPRGGLLRALIVDHGLRCESAGEARATQAVLAGLGIGSTILAWSGAKPATGLQEAARRHRYRLLRSECRRIGFLHLALGHQAADQAETVAMRAARGSGPDGLSGMAALLELPELRLLRPLLTVERSRLTSTLRCRGIAWLDDPSNADPRFERARLRLGPALGAAPWPARERHRREIALAQSAVELLEFDAPGMAAFDRDGFMRLPGNLQSRLLGRLVQAIGGRDYPPRQARLAAACRRLCGAIHPGGSGRAQDFTLSGCRLALRQVSQGGRLRWIVRPENGRNGGQALIPAAFFDTSACGAAAASHLECHCSPRDIASESVQP